MQAQHEDEISLAELIVKVKNWVNYLRTKWLIIFLIATIGGTVGLVHAYLSKPEYTATLTFALEEDKSAGGMGGAIGLASQLGFDLGSNVGGAFSSANLLELMKSRTLVEKVLLSPVSYEGKPTTLAELYLSINEWKESKDELSMQDIHFLPDTDSSRFTRAQDSTLGLIYKAILSENLVVSQKDKKTSINVIEVKSRNEFFSKVFTETLAIVVSGFYIETKTKKSMQNVSILQKQVDSIRGELNSALTGAAVLTDNIYALNPAMNVKRVSPAKRQIDVQANTAILTQLVQNLEISKMALMRETPLIQIIDKPILPLKKEKKSKRNGLLYGGFLSAFICITIISFHRIWKKLLKS